MNVAMQQPWTVERFLDWAAAQEGRYEFDGSQPVGMTGGTVNHSRITNNIQAALRARLRGSPCASFGPDLGVQIGNAVRFPDVLISCGSSSGEDRLATDVRVVFEVLSPSTARTDRVIKVQEYAGVPSICRYVLVETRFAGLMVLHRSGPDDPWTAAALDGDAVLALPEATIDVPVAEFYEDVVPTG